MKPQTLNLNGRLLLLNDPLVMGILNVTPDSFYSGSRKQGDKEIHDRIEEIVSQGGRMVDVGAYSTRPGAEAVDAATEIARLKPALEILRDEYPDLPISVDTFRADVARAAVEEYGADMINDVSGGQIDRSMFSTVASLRVPYILMHMRGTPETMQQYTEYNDVAVDILDYFIDRVGQLRSLGVNDIILDTGFGFSKTVDQNYELMARMEELNASLQLPLLVGISRKSMIYKYLGGTPHDALNGTAILNTYSLLHGADILRVHDVKEAVECVKLVSKLRNYERINPSQYVHLSNPDSVMRNENMQ
ncbi:dihydropteroate synthase [Porphyromonas pogonae]|uniref:dihydropteroate synthase n=1 Tax=Porphyromonas pogonae TaxID=867595 RepID=UPI002E7851CE|nr:dihydropteroate synthase [Porphyromonas pogonae]